jgi:hypothetical protein
MLGDLSKTGFYIRDAWTIIVFDRESDKNTAQKQMVAWVS